MVYSIVRDLLEKSVSSTLYFITICIIGIGCTGFVFPEQAMAISSTYYIDSSLGSDANTGLDRDHPWRSIKKINSTLFVPGDHILLKRGGIWHETLTLGKKSTGIAENPITISSYGAGEKPHITATKGVVLLNKGYITINNIAISQTQRFIEIINSPGVHIANLTAFHSTSDGIYVKDSPGVVIVDSVIQNTGRHGIFFHDSTAGKNTHNGVAKNNTFTNINAYGITTIGLSATTPLTGFVFQHNTLTDVGDGIYLHWTNNSVVSANTITGTDTNKTRSAEGPGISLRSSSENTISYNSISKTNVVGITLWGDTRLPDGPSEKNSIFNNNISDTIGTSYGISITGNIAHPGTHIYQNTFYHVHSPIIGEKAHPETIVENNNIYTASAPDPHPLTTADIPVSVSPISDNDQLPLKTVFVRIFSDEVSYIRNNTRIPKDSHELYDRVIDTHDTTVSQTERITIQNFIAYGTPKTMAFGAGERAGTISSFISAYQKPPTTIEDWEDSIKIILGRFPNQRNAEAEQRAEKTFHDIYHRQPDMDTAYDRNAVMVAAYGLRPQPRDMAKERTAIQHYTAIFSRPPHTTLDWDAVRVIAYSGARR